MSKLEVEWYGSRGRVESSDSGSLGSNVDDVGIE